MKTKSGSTAQKGVLKPSLSVFSTYVIVTLKLEKRQQILVADQWPQWPEDKKGTMEKLFKSLENVLSVKEFV